MTARKTGNGEENVYAAAQEWVNRALRADDSLFTPGKAIWTRELLGELHRRILVNPPVPGFFDKTRIQLEDSSPHVRQLMAETLHFHYLIRWVGSVKAETKESRINEVLDSSGQDLKFPESLRPSLTPGLVHMGAAVANLDDFVGYLVEFAESWKELDRSAQESYLSDPWEFKQFSSGKNLKGELFEGYLYIGQWHALLHLVFPDTFEPITSDSQKYRLVERLAPFITEHSEDVDHNIQQIRQAIERRNYGQDFDFFDPGISSLWGPFNQVWDPADTYTDLLTAANLSPADSFQTLAAETYLPLSFLEEIRQLLEEKKQVIFQGPPGTGKTFLARKLARALAGGDDAGKDRVTLVQFHPSYAYEDFVQGFRPTLTEEGQAGFELRNGPLVRAAKAAESDEGNPHYLIIDEINRGNLAKVFGELYFLLEYRDEKMNLQYSDEPFALPDNLYIIGTMNTADRSIALVDLALRRRFYFKEFHPAKAPVKDVLRKWLAAKAEGMEWVAEVVDAANRKLADDPHAAIGPSYFMREGLDVAGVERVWEHSVKPYLEERLFGNSERLAEFELGKLIAEVGGQGQGLLDSGLRWNDGSGEVGGQGQGLLDSGAGRNDGPGEVRGQGQGLLDSGLRRNDGSGEVGGQGQGLLDSGLRRNDGFESESDDGTVVGLNEAEES